MSKKLYFYYGTMASAKTLRLLTTAYNFEENNIKIMVMKPSQDTRDGDGVIKSRVGLVRKCTMIQPDADLFLAVEHYNTQMLSRFSKLEWVLVDEAQFLSEKQVDQLAKVVDVLGISVMCYGLRTDFQSHLFPGSKRLLELADEINEVFLRQQTWIKQHHGENFLVHTPTTMYNFHYPSMQKHPVCRNYVEVFGRAYPENFEYLMGFPIGASSPNPLPINTFEQWI